MLSCGRRARPPRTGIHLRELLAHGSSRVGLALDRYAGRGVDFSTIGRLKSALSETKPLSTSRVNYIDYRPSHHA